MRYPLLLAALLTASSLLASDTAKKKDIPQAQNITVICQKTECKKNTLKEDKKITVSVVGQGVAPMNTISPAQAYALAKRAAIADAYRLLAEKVKGVHIDGHDTVKNMMVQRSTVKSSVEAMIRNANIVETTFKEGLCEVEMEITLSYADFQ